ncbi:TetR/AcrR family transcriptional regulator [Oceanicella sp. SM1341]|uniref:TetR/AcrR family transcriptional regulator n=1 Tax=Oceanicella sp. SM1341 TaxID=1548889 RepID=UPI001300B749|nr:TetR/AcrR family transcriptional regulator [Oceanicella sp. SM1341]
MRPKSDDVRKAILAAATELFTRDGYAATTMSRIARTGGMSTSNLYVYYPSKLAIMLEIYEPWLKEQVSALEARVAAEEGAEAKLRCLVRGILEDIPADPDGYTRALVQAVSVTGPPDGYTSDLLRWAEGRILEILNQVGDFGRAGVSPEAISYMLMLIFDGVGLRRDLPPRPELSARLHEAMVSLLLARVRAPAEPA